MFKILQTYTDSSFFQHPNSVNMETRPYNRWTCSEVQALLCIFVEKENQHELESVKCKGVRSDLGKVGWAKHEPRSKTGLGETQEAQAGLQEHQRPQQPEWLQPSVKQMV